MKLKLFLAAVLNAVILSTAPVASAQWGNNPPPIRTFGTPNGHGLAGLGVFNATIQANHNRIDYKHANYRVENGVEYNITEALFDFWWPAQCAPTLTPASSFPAAAQLRFPRGCSVSNSTRGTFLYNGIPVGGEFTINPAGYRNNQRLVYYAPFRDEVTGELVFRFGN